MNWNDTGCSRQALVIGGQLLGLLKETLGQVSLGSCVGVFERAASAVNKQRETPVMGQSVYGGSIAGDNNKTFLLLILQEMIIFQNFEIFNTALFFIEIKYWIYLNFYLLPCTLLFLLCRCCYHLLKIKSIVHLLPYFLIGIFYSHLYPCFFYLHCWSTYGDPTNK